MEAEYRPDLQVSELIHGNIDVTMQILETLPTAIADCAQLIVHSLLSENKLLSCGVGQSAALSQILTANLLNRFHYDRPSLPAINISADATTLTAIAGDNSFQDIFANQIRALGQSGDLLLLIAQTSSNVTLQAIQAAHDREMIVIPICSEQCQDISALMLPEDMELRVPSTNRARIAEAQLLIIHCICELIDQQLFGGY